MTRRLPSLLLSLTATFASVFSIPPARADSPPTSYVDRLSALSSEAVSKDKESSSGMRMKAVAEAAFSLGARAGLASETSRIDLSLQKNENLLDKIFDFRGISLGDGRIAPPVIFSSRDAMKLDSPTEMQRVRVSWHIVHPAVLLTAMPDWRMYLIKHYEAPDTTKIPHLLLPKTPEEQAVWKKNVHEGYKNGVEQARRSFSIDLRRLRMDYVGMVRFHALAVRHVLTLPVYAHTDLGVVRRSGDRLDVGVRIYRISLPTSFTPSEKWKDRGVLSGVRRRLDTRSSHDR